MTLEPGKKLGPYEILEQAGAGGMGEVFKAKDTRLDRTVAIKVLSSQIAGNPDLKERFEREAKAISSLNHPNICTLYDVGSEDGIEYLVMEYLEGETLSERLKKGPLPTDELLKFAMQIADALDKAHREGLIHRDLKPANVMITADGAKLLDFGLAKVTVSGGVVQGISGVTRTTPLTGAGTILGTIQYMAPEQLEGKEADTRSDIFAFGALLYEMATGKPAFEGSSQASLIAGILEREPVAITTISPMAPPALERIVKKCLSKDPGSRWQSAWDLADEIRWIAQAGSLAGIPAPMSARRKFRLRITSVVAVIAIVIAGSLATIIFMHEEPETEVMRFSIAAQPGLSNITWPRISPDGKLLAFHAADSTGTRRLYIRPMNALEAFPLQGTEEAGRAFWSPDSRYLAYFTGSQLKKIRAAGGPAQLICECDGVDGSWGSQGVIIFDKSATDSIRQVPAAGGEPTAATTRDLDKGESYHAWPWFLPDGNHFLYFTNLDNSSQGSSEHILKVGSLDGKVNKELFRVSSRIEYSPAGYILFNRDGILLARGFDADRLEVSAEPIPVAENLANFGNRAFFSVSDNNKLVYLSGATVGQNELIWLDRGGNEIEKIGEPAAYGDIALSPDQSRLAYDLYDERAGSNDIWVRDLRRNVASRLTFHDGHDSWPIWSPDGTRIVYATDNTGNYTLRERLANGLGEPRDIVLPDSGNGGPAGPSDWSADGGMLIYVQFRQAFDILLLDLIDSTQSRPLIATPHVEDRPSLSPNGRFLAYRSNESGRFELYVRDLGEIGGKWQVSNDGCYTPRWRADGQELFYVNLEWDFIAVPVTIDGDHFEAGIPETLFNRRYATGGTIQRRYDVSLDGSTFSC